MQKVYSIQLFVEHLLWIRHCTRHWNVYELYIYIKEVFKLQFRAIQYLLDFLLYLIFFINC